MTDIYWIVEESRLIGFADQARRLSGKTGPMSPSQIEDALKSVTVNTPTTSSGLCLSKPMLGPGTTIISAICISNVPVPD